MRKLEIGEADALGYAGMLFAAGGVALVFGPGWGMACLGALMLVTAVVLR